MTGTVHLRDHGVDFRVADTVSIRVAWRGSKEVGNSQPNSELVARLKAIGAANRQSEADADLQQFLAKGRRARAEILEASPTQLKVGSGEDERRIWSLRLRVHPDDGPAFETSAEHGFRLSPDFEEKIERGFSLSMIPEAGADLEIVYDPDDHELALVFPRGDETGSLKRIRFGGIAGGPL